MDSARLIKATLSPLGYTDSSKFESTAKSNVLQLESHLYLPAKTSR